MKATARFRSRSSHANSSNGAAAIKRTGTPGELRLALRSLAAAAAGVTLQIQSVPELVTPFFSPVPVERYSQAAASDLERYGVWCRALLEHGVIDEDTVKSIRASARQKAIDARKTVLAAPLPDAATVEEGVYAD